jgi:hypothetical protein
MQKLSYYRDNHIFFDNKNFEEGEADSFSDESFLEHIQLQEVKHKHLCYK